MKNTVLMIDACQTTINYNYCLLDAFVNKGERIVYATTMYPYENVLPPEGIKVRYCFFYMARAAGMLTGLRLVRRLLRGVEYPLNMSAIVFYILMQHIKVIHIMNSPFPIFDSWIIKLLQKMGRRIVCTAHNPFPHEEKSSSLCKYSRLYHQADRIITLANFTKEEIVSRSAVSEKKISVIPHGDFDYVFSRYDTNDDLAKKVKCKSQGRPIVSFIGIIRPYKGLKYFLQAFTLIKEKVPDCFFLVAGSMLLGDRDDLGKLLKTSCEPEDLWSDIRYLPTSDMKAYLSVTDILVQPYISASQSGNTVMAYKAGVPVISTSVGGLAEMTIDGQTGYVIAPKDPLAIANAVAKFFQQDNLAKMSNAARVVATEQYSWQNIAAQTIEIYDQLSETAQKT